MALLWAYDTTVALRQLGKTRVTVALIEGLIGFTTTVTAGNSLHKGQMQALANKGIHRHFTVANGQAILHGARKLGAHLGDGTTS
jgi:hypothetical protein